ncbi:MAG: hypothetical protein IJ040_08425 [Lachnospiraceae bacterium]|nr:hypothetical protein [Lachnospiraceae bacterium]
MKPKKLIRKAGALLTAGALMLGTVTQVFATPSPPSRTDGEGFLTPWNATYNTGLTVYVNGTSYPNQPEFLDLEYSDGSWGGSVFCLEPGTDVTQGDTVTGGVFDSDYAKLTLDQRRAINRAMGFMTHDYNPDGDQGQKISAHSYYWTYQCLIWHYAGYMSDDEAMQTLQQTRTIPSGEYSGTYSVGAPPEYTRIRQLMDEYETRPSFGARDAGLIDASCTYELALDPNTGTYSTIIHDTSGMLSQGRMENPSSTNGNLTFTQCNADGSANASGEYLKISTSVSIPQSSPATVSQLKKAEYNPIATQCAVFYNGTTGHQTVLGKGVMGSDPRSVHFAVYTQASPLTISKKDITSGNELPGAEMTLIDKASGAVIESWTSTTTPHPVANITSMVAGKTYILREVLAPANYKKATDIEFVYSGNPGQVVEMYNELHGVVRVYKTGPVLSGTVPVEMSIGGEKVTINRMKFDADAFADVTFKIYNAADDSVVATITTDASGYATSPELPCGQGQTYYMKEVATPAGAVLESEKIPLTIAFDGTTATYVAPASVNNDVTGVKINVHKQGELVLPNLDENGVITYDKKPIADVYYGLFTKEAIAYSGGSIKKDTLVAVGKTNAGGIASIEGSVVAGEYYVKEIAKASPY